MQENEDATFNMPCLHSILTYFGINYFHGSKHKFNLTSTSRNRTFLKYETHSCVFRGELFLLENIIIVILINSCGKERKFRGSFFPLYYRVIWTLSVGVNGPLLIWWMTIILMEELVSSNGKKLFLLLVLLLFIVVITFVTIDYVVHLS